MHVLQEVDMADFQEKGYDLGTLMDSILCPNKEVSWAVTKRGISMYDFPIETRIWLNIIYSRVSPCTHWTYVKELLTLMVT